MRHFKRTYRRTLQRSIASGTYDPKNPILVPIKEDRRYRHFVSETEPRSAALILYMMDVSGSMGQEQKDIVRSEAFWIDMWIKRFYKDVHTRFIIHDAKAREVDRDTFFRTRESGGTLISSAYKLASDIIDQEYPIDDWNIYLFHFSDGDNWSGNDTADCMKLLESTLLNVSNMFCYGQVESRYGSGQFLRDLHKQFGESHEQIITTQIKDRDAIIDALKVFLGKGK